MTRAFGARNVEAPLFFALDVVAANNQTDSPVRAMAPAPGPQRKRRTLGGNRRWWQRTAAAPPSADQTWPPGAPRHGVKPTWLCSESEEGLGRGDRQWERDAIMGFGA